MNQEELKKIKEKIEMNSYSYKTIGATAKAINTNILFKILDESLGGDE